MKHLFTNATASKKAMKRDINKNGFFINFPMNLKPNVPEEMKTKVPEGAMYFEGIASNGDLNRNGYKIREKAWIDAISDYFVNPIILLQHDTDEPIGNALFARISNNGLEVGGYVWDEYTDGKFSRGLFKALSTGHYDIECEFENEQTGEVLSEPDFIEKYNPSRSWWDGSVIPPDGWIRCVTKLEWVEFSIVSIGSNRKSLVTKQNDISTYFRNKYAKTNDEETTPETPPAQPVIEPIVVEPEKKEEEKPEEVKPEEVKEPEVIEAKDPGTETIEKQDNKVNKEGDECDMEDGEKGTMQTVDGKLVCTKKNNIEPENIQPIEPAKEPETTPASETTPVEGAGTTVEPSKEIEAEKSPIEKLLINGMSVLEFETAFKKLYAEGEEKDKQIDTLLDKVDELQALLRKPAPKGLKLLPQTQFQPEKKEVALGKLFKEKGVEFRE